MNKGPVDSSLSWIDHLQNAVYYFTQTQFFSYIHIPTAGFVGGMAVFLYSWHTGVYKNSKIPQKLMIETLGGAITSSFTFPLIALFVVVESISMEAAVAFVIGVSWAGVIKTLRDSVSKSVEKALEKTIQPKS